MAALKVLRENPEQLGTLKGGPAGWVDDAAREASSEATERAGKAFEKLYADPEAAMRAFEETAGSRAETARYREATQRLHGSPEAFGALREGVDRARIPDLAEGAGRAHAAHLGAFEAGQAAREHLRGERAKVKW